MKFIHVTDSHLVAPGSRLHGLDPQARFARCIDSINELHADAECCVITGDLAERGGAEAYEFLAAELARCAIPTHLVVGNHDDRIAFRQAFPEIPGRGQDFVQADLETSAGVFLTLDTVQPGTHAGSYCSDRQEWLRSKLTEHASRPVFIFMHHPPFDIQIPALDVIGLAEKDEFAQIVTSHSNVRHIFFGHAHRPLSGVWKGISFSSLRGTNHQIGLDFVSDTITYVDEPPDYSIVFIDDEQIVVHTHTY